MPELKKIQCPFCSEITIDCLYTPSIVTEKITRSATFGSTKQISRTKEKYEILSGCSNCEKTKNEISKAFKEGTPEDKEKRKKRYEEIMKLREELNKERSST